MGKEKEREKLLFDLVKSHDPSQLLKVLNKAKNSKSSKRLNVNCVDDKGLSTLHHAARLGHAKVIEALLENGARVDLSDAMGYRALHHATVRGNVECIVPLLKWGADVNEQAGDGGTSLHIACFLGHLSVVKILVTDFRASLTMRTVQEKTPLDIACEQDRSSIVQYLIQYPDVRLQLNCARMADPNWSWLRRRKFTALHLAARNGHIDVLNLLVLQADTPSSMFSMSSSSSNVAGSAIASYGSSKSSGSSSNLYSAVCAAASSNVPVDINLCTSRGTALHEAAYAGHYHVVKFLLEHGINPALRNQNGQTALDVCIKKLQETEEQAKRVQLTYIIELLQNVPPTASLRRSKHSNKATADAVNHSSQFASIQQLSARSSVMQPSQNLPMFTSVQSLNATTAPPRPTTIPCSSNGLSQNAPNALGQTVYCTPGHSPNQPLPPSAIYSERSQSCDYIAAILAQNNRLATQRQIAGSVMEPAFAQTQGRSIMENSVSASLNSFPLSLPFDPSCITDSSSTNTLLQLSTERVDCKDNDSGSDTDTGEVTPVRQRSPERPPTVRHDGLLLTQGIMPQRNSLADSGNACSSPSIQSYAHSVASQRSLESDSGISLALSGESATASPSYRAAGNSASAKPNSLEIQGVKTSPNSDDEKTPTVSSVSFQTDNTMKENRLMPKVNVTQMNALLATGLPDSDALKLFLTELELPGYFELFANAGYADEFWLMRYLTALDLSELGISNTTHQQLILTNLASLSDALSTSANVQQTPVSTLAEQKAVQRRSFIRMDFLRRPSLRKSGAPSPNREQLTLKEWLISIKLPDLEPLFAQQGYYTLLQLVNAVHSHSVCNSAALTDNDLREFGIIQHAQRRKIFVELEKVRKLLGIRSASTAADKAVVDSRSKQPVESAAQRKMTSFSVQKPSLSPATSSLLSSGSSSSGSDCPGPASGNLLTLASSEDADLTLIPPPPSFGNEDEAEHSNDTLRISVPPSSGYVLQPSSAPILPASFANKSSSPWHFTPNGDTVRQVDPIASMVDRSVEQSGMQYMAIVPSPNPVPIPFKLSPQPQAVMNLNNQFSAQQATVVNISSAVGAPSPILSAQQAGLHLDKQQMQLRRFSTSGTTDRADTYFQKPAVPDRRDSLSVLVASSSNCSSAASSPRPSDRLTRNAIANARTANPDMAVFEDIDSLLTGLTEELTQLLQKP